MDDRRRLASRTAIAAAARPFPEIANAPPRRDALSRMTGPFGLRAEGLAALAGIAALMALAVAGALTPARAQEAKRSAPILVAAEAKAQSTGPWTVVDLGIARLEEHCVEAATLAFKEVARVHGADLLRRTAWTVEIVGINHGRHDAVIACTYAATTKTRALLMIHSRSNGVEAVTIARKVNVSFAAHAKRIGRAWLDSLGG
ncbi:MAG: hypothetical protein ACJA1L_000509 [Paracoccaceae bacterium]|jgi:hypothetical protein